MNEETFNMSVRKFLKLFGINAQRDIEQAVAKAIASGRLGSTGTLPVKATLAIDTIGLHAVFDGKIELG